jgi:hypothetical protein
MVGKKITTFVMILGMSGLLNSELLAAGKQKTAPDVTGTWSGTFVSNSNLPPFTMTIVINRDSQGRLVAASNLGSDCFHSSDLQVNVDGYKVVLAGSDPQGNNLTLRGTVDDAVTLLTLDYIVNGSAGGNCESDRGTGNLGKR